MHSRSVSLFIVACAVATAAVAFNPQPEPPGFGMVGIISTQTARLNVSFLPPPDGDRGAFPPGPCAGAVHLSFVDGSGNVVAESTVRLAGNTSEALEYMMGVGREAGASSRQQIRAVVSWVEYPPGPCKQGALFGTVEVYNTETGETQFVLPGTFGGFQDR